MEGPGCWNPAPALRPWWGEIERKSLGLRLGRPRLPCLLCTFLTADKARTAPSQVVGDACGGCPLLSCTAPSPTWSMAFSRSPVLPYSSLHRWISCTPGLISARRAPRLFPDSGATNWRGKEPEPATCRHQGGVSWSLGPHKDEKRKMQWSLGPIPSPDHALLCGGC